MVVIFVKEVLNGILYCSSLHIILLLLLLFSVQYRVRLEHIQVYQFMLLQIA